MAPKVYCGQEPHVWEYISNGKHRETVGDVHMGRKEILCLQWETLWNKKRKTQRFLQREKAKTTEGVPFLVEITDWVVRSIFFYC